MTNKERYHFSDFTLGNYRALLKIAKERYTFRFFTNFDKNEKFVLWRHDIDFSVENALKLAQIESEEGISTTYCVLLHSKFYNLLEKDSVEYIREIIGMGHRIGLHFDPAFYNIETEEDFNISLLIEKEILEKYFRCEINMFAFHNITPMILKYRNWQYEGMVNAYAEYFKEGVAYCSDSNGYWRYERLEDILLNSSDSRMQVLTHPVWWQEKAMSPKKRILLTVDQRAEKTKQFYDAFLKKNDRSNID